MKVCRAMKADDELPIIGFTSRTLGVRAGVDIPVVFEESPGLVGSGAGGVSVSPASPENLPRHRRPPQFCGTGKDPIFELETDDLPEELAYRPDPDNPRKHGFIEPTQNTLLSFERYQQLIHETRGLWRLV